MESVGCLLGVGEGGIVKSCIWLAECCGESGVVWRFVVQILVATLGNKLTWTSCWRLLQGVGYPASSGRVSVCRGRAPLQSCRGWSFFSFQLWTVFVLVVGLQVGDDFVVEMEYSYCFDRGYMLLVEIVVATGVP